MTRILLQVKKFLTLDVAIFVLLIISLLMKNDLYALHPFFIVLLTLASNYRFRSYIACNLVALLVAFTISFDYGFLITVILSTFFLLKMVVNCFIDNAFCKQFIPFIFTTLLYYLYLVIQDKNFENIIMILALFVSSVLAFYSMYPFIKTIKYKDKFNQKNRILSLSLFPLFFLGFNPFFALILRAIHLFYVYSLKKEEAASCILLSSLIATYLCKFDLIVFCSFVIPYLIVLFFAEKKYLLFYALGFVGYEALCVKEFYINEYFYQGLIALLINAFVLSIGYDKFYQVIYQENKSLDQEKTTISAIKKYINIVLSPSLENSNYPKDEIVTQINQELCNKCSKSKVCKLIPLRDKSVEKKLDITERKIIINNCETPYRFFRQSSIMRKIYENEYKKVESSIAYQNAYKTELNNIYTPLMLLEKETVNYIEQLQRILIEEEFKVIDIVEFSDQLEIKIREFEKTRIKALNSIIEDVYQKSCTFLRSAYSFSSGCYLLLFTFKNQYKVDYFYTNKGVNKTQSGDYVKIKIEGNKLQFLLSDGMGHNAYSSSLSEYLVESLMAFSEINSDYAQQIKTVNNLIYNKTSKEAYATLDYFNLDLVNLKFNLFKAGSFPNFIYHNFKIKESKKNFPPLGILKEVEPFAYVDTLCDQDVLIFMSDGFGEDISHIIDAIASSNAYRNAKEIHDVLLNALNSETNVIDDKTLVVFKIEKIK